MFKLITKFNRFWKQPSTQPLSPLIVFNLVRIFTVSLIITAAVLGIREIDSLEKWELAAFDWMIRLTKQDQVDERLLIVEITESDIQKFNQWPLSDAILAQLLKKLQVYHPKAIGLDILRDIPHPPGYEEFLQQLEADNVIVITELVDINRVPPPPNVPPERISFNDIVVDIDGIIRRNLLYAQTETEKFYSLPLRLSLKYLADSNVTFEVNHNYLKINDTFFLPIDPNSGSYKMTPSDTLGWQILLDYPSEELARKVTITEVLENQVNPDWIKDKVVLIGTTAPSEKDLFFTPFSGGTNDSNFKMPGVILHAQRVSQILSMVLDNQGQIWYWQDWQEYLWVWFWSLIGALIVWHLYYPLSIAFRLIITSFGLGLICLIVFINGGWIPFIPAVLALIFTSGSVLAYQIFYLVYYEPLTNLPNRRLLGEIINKFQNQSNINQITVISISLNRLNLITQSLGENFSNQLILATVNRLKKLLLSNQKLARTSQDKLAILSFNVKDIREIIELSNNVQKILIEPFNINGQDIFTTVNIGIASQSSENLQKAEDLLKDADLAMYRAITFNKNRPEIFERKMQIEIINRLQLETDLYNAIAAEEFQVYYQPIICLKTGKISGFEALVRWISPQRGFVSPGQFIPTAEETGLIIPLGTWILKTACQQMSIWHQKYAENDPYMISVNLSGRQFAQSDLVETVAQIIQTTQINPATLKLEITESIVMDNVEESIILLERLKALNLRLSIDDFGTGYSSFSYLHSFPLDTLKVDQSFVRRMEEDVKYQEIVKTIIMLGHNLGMDIIAEGIEEESQISILKNHQCEYGQGYFFAKPLPKDEIEVLLDKNLQWQM